MRADADIRSCSILGGFWPTRPTCSASSRRGPKGFQLHHDRCCRRWSHLRNDPHVRPRGTKHNEQGMARGHQRVHEGKPGEQIEGGCGEARRRQPALMPDYPRLSRTNMALLHRRTRSSPLPSLATPTTRARAPWSRALQRRSNSIHQYHIWDNYQCEVLAVSVYCPSQHIGHFSCVGCRTRRGAKGSRRRSDGQAKTCILHFRAAFATV
jgi:hypothetical protein